MKDIRKLYQPYYPKILKDNNGFKYNLSEESIFGNLHYSNQEFLKGKSSKFNSISQDKDYADFRNKSRSKKLIPILRYKKAN